MTCSQRLRCLALHLVCALASAGACAWLGPAAWSLRLGSRFPVLVIGLCDLAVIGCLLWGWSVAAVVMIERLRGRPRPSSTLAPRWARRLVLTLCGLAVLLPAPSLATQGEVDHAGGSRVLSGLPLPDRATGGELPSRHAPATRHHGPAGRLDTGPAALVVVRAGDSLWSISARRLGPGASADDIAVATEALYRANRAVIGPDPDLIRPGQHLRVPTAPTPTRTAR